MRRYGSTSLLGMVCAVVGTAIALSGCAPIGAPDRDPAAPSPTRSAAPTGSPAGPQTDPRTTPRTDPEADPTDSTKRPTRAPGDKLQPGAEAPPMGLDVRYVDEDGNYKVLRVEDFPR